MAKGRMVNRTVAHDDRLAQLSADSELVFLKTIPHLDRDGKILGHPSTIRGQCVPRRADREGWTDDDVARLMLEWTNTLDVDGHPDPLVLWYDVAGVQVCFFRGFKANQTLKPTEPRSVLPDPPNDLMQGSLNPRPPLKGPDLRDHMVGVRGPVSEEKRRTPIDETPSRRDDGQPGTDPQPGNEEPTAQRLDADVALAPAPALQDAPALTLVNDGNAQPGNAEAPRPSAQDLVGEYVEMARGRGLSKVPDRVLGQLGRELKQLLDEGQPAAAIRAGLELLVGRALGPSQIAACVQQVQLERGGREVTRADEPEQDLAAYVRA